MWILIISGCLCIWMTAESFQSGFYLNGFVCAIGAVILNYYIIDDIITDKKNNPFKDFGDYSFSGWDGEDAVPISKKVINDAKCLLANLPKSFRNVDTAPGIDGSVCLEWTINNDGTFFIDFNPDGSVSIYVSIPGRTIKKEFPEFNKETLEYIQSIFVGM